MSKEKNTEDKMSLARRWIQDWVDNKAGRLKDSVQRTRKAPDELMPEHESREAMESAWEVVWDLKYTLEFAGGSIFTRDDPLKVPDWDFLHKQIQKLLPADEIWRMRKQMDEEDEISNNNMK